MNKIIISSIFSLIFIQVSASQRIQNSTTDDSEQNTIPQVNCIIPNFQDIIIQFNVNTDVNLLLYTRKNLNEPQNLTWDPDAIKETNFVNRNTRFLIHGWNNNGTSPFSITVKDAILSAADVNVIVVDWGAGANTDCYVVARNRVLEVGPFIAQYIDFLISNSLLSSYGQINIIGHSLGAHIAGITGKFTSSKVAVIFGLDPASLFFDTKYSNERLAEDDAISTVALHTNGKVLGFFEPLAKVDLYANGGISQPGCEPDPVGTCAHSRAYKYFNEAVNPNTNSYIAHKCNTLEDVENDSCNGDAVLFKGETNSIEYKGIYYFETNSLPPY